MNNQSLTEPLVDVQANETSNLKENIPEPEKNGNPLENISDNKIDEENGKIGSQEECVSFEREKGQISPPIKNLGSQEKIPVPTEGNLTENMNIGGELWYDPSKHPDLSKAVQKKFVKIIIICVIFIIGELVGGILANSIVILADASH